jgi:hypothetical protein
MPVHKVKGVGEQYGKHGKVYHGPGAHAKAVKQGQAIKASQARSGKKGR